MSPFELFILDTLAKIHLELSKNVHSHVIIIQIDSKDNK